MVGSDPRQVRNVGGQLYERVSNEGGHIHRTAMAGIEEACWDILGKSLGVPVYQLFGGRVRDTVDCYANGWYRTERTPEAFAEAAAVASGPGFRALKFDPRARPRVSSPPGELGRSRDIIAAMRAAAGPGVRLLIDLHARLAPAEAVAFIDLCADLDVFWWEEPTTRDARNPPARWRPHGRPRGHRRELPHRRPVPHPPESGERLYPPARTDVPGRPPAHWR